MPRLTKTDVCQICGQTKSRNELIPGGLIRSPLLSFIRKRFPQLPEEGYICLTDMSKLRNEYVEEMLTSERGELSALEMQILDSLRNHEIISRNIDTEFDRRASFGERLSDRIAEFGGSWPFIITFILLLFFWIALNSFILVTKPFDPYPFILLNLVLSCVAALQAPVIMMSQNRQEEKDRLRAEHDYQVNLKAELEIRHLHEKLDHLLLNQWQRLLEIQQVQIELMEEISERRKAGKHGK